MFAISIRRTALLFAGLTIIGLGILEIGTPIGFAAQESVVRLDNFTFGPKELNVPVGTKVVWTNRDDIPHTVVSADGPAVFKSKPLDTDDHFEFTFDKAGTYKYFCSIHPKMTGTVTVR